METSQAINLLKTASGLLLNQKNVAFFEEKNYEKNKPNATLSALGIDTNTVLGGAFSEAKELLVGGKSGLGDVVDSIASYILEVEPLQASANRSSKVFDHPIEWNRSASTSPNAQNFITDHCITLPATFECILVLPTFLYTSVVDDLKTLLNKKELVRIITKGDFYPNMVLVSFSKPLTVDRLSRLVISTQWREIQMNYPPDGITKDASNTSPK